MNVPANTEDNLKTKEQLIHELNVLRKKVDDSDRLLNDTLDIYKEAPVGLCVFDLDFRFSRDDNTRSLCNNPTK